MDLQPTSRALAAIARGVSARVGLLALIICLSFPVHASAGGQPAIAGVQVALRAQGLYTGSVDGVPGPLTAGSLRVLQRRAGLPANGRIDLRTLGALGRLGGPPLGSRIVKRRSIGLDVAMLQFLLAAHGFPCGDFDGVFGPRTEFALRRFQSWAEITADGAAGRETLIALRQPAPVSPRFLAWPLNGVLTSSFGPRGGRFHAGIDLAAPAGTPVTAVAPGRVTWAGWRDGGWGRLVTLAHPGGVRTMYAHLSRVRAVLGTSVARGEVIGLVGRTGVRVSAPHLHLEVRVRGAAADPLSALPSP